MKSTFLWFDRWITLDDASSSYADTWVNAPHEYIDFSDVEAAYFTIEYWGVGPGAADVELYIQRCAAITAKDGCFQDMNAAALAVTRASGALTPSFGPDGTAGDKYPRGVGRLRAVNTNAVAGNWAAVRVRVSVALVRR